MQIFSIADGFLDDFGMEKMAGYYSIQRSRLRNSRFPLRGYFKPGTLQQSVIRYEGRKMMGGQWAAETSVSCIEGNITCMLEPVFSLTSSCQCMTSRTNPTTHGNRSSQRTIRLNIKLYSTIPHDKIMP